MGSSNCCTQVFKAPLKVFTLKWRFFRRKIMMTESAKLHATCLFKCFSSVAGLDGYPTMVLGSTVLCWSSNSHRCRQRKNSDYHMLSQFHRNIHAYWKSSTVTGKHLCSESPHFACQECAAQEEQKSCSYDYLGARIPVFWKILMYFCCILQQTTATSGVLTNQSWNQSAKRAT